jgi:TonB family protein
MRFWFQSTTNMSMLSPSAAWSVAAHVVLFGGAIYGSGPKPLTPPDDTMTEQVYFLPPPDRIKGNQAAIKLRFVEQGNGAGISVTGKESPDGVQAGARALHAADDVGGSAGSDAREQTASAPAMSADSVTSILAAEQSAVRVEGSAAPIYPPELIEQMLFGSVLTHFVIDTSGHVDMSTVEIISSAHPLFVQSVRDAMPGMRFYPASVDGRKVRQLVEQRFEFRLMPIAPVGAPAEHTKANPSP